MTWISALFLMALAVTLTACTSPREHLYSLAGTSGTTPRVSADVPTIELGPLSVPELIDRPQLVLRDSEFTVIVNEQERWAAPLKDQLLRVLAADLDAQLPDRRVIPSSSAAINEPVGRLAIEITDLELSKSQGVFLAIHWVYRPLLSQTAAREGNASAAIPLRQVGYPGYVEALNRACTMVTAQLGRQL